MTERFSSDGPDPEKVGNIPFHRDPSDVEVVDVTDIGLADRRLVVFRAVDAGKFGELVDSMGSTGSSDFVHDYSGTASTGNGTGIVGAYQVNLPDGTVSHFIAEIIDRPVDAGFIGMTGQDTTGEPSPYEGFILD